MVWQTGPNGNHASHITKCVRIGNWLRFGSPFLWHANCLALAIKDNGRFGKGEKERERCFPFDEQYYFDRLNFIYISIKFHLRPYCHASIAPPHQIYSNETSQSIAWLEWTSFKRKKIYVFEDFKFLLFYQKFCNWLRRTEPYRDAQLLGVDTVFFIIHTELCTSFETMVHNLWLFNFSESKYKRNDGKKRNRKRDGEGESKRFKDREICLEMGHTNRNYLRSIYENEKKNSIFPLFNFISNHNRFGFASLF